MQLPTGCGEQNAALFAPNIYVRNYLVAIGKLTDELKQKTDRFMMTGDVNNNKISISIMVSFRVSKTTKLQASRRFVQCVGTKRF